MNILLSESGWYACQLPPCLERQVQWIFKCPRGSLASMAKGEIVLKRDLCEQHYATHGTLVETHIQIFPFFILKLKHILLVVIRFFFSKCGLNLYTKTGKLWVTTAIWIVWNKRAAIRSCDLSGSTVFTEVKAYMELRNATHFTCFCALEEDALKSVAVQTEVMSDLYPILDHMCELPKSYLMFIRSGSQTIKFSPLFQGFGSSFWMLYLVIQ